MGVPSRAAPLSVRLHWSFMSIRTRWLPLTLAACLVLVMAAAAQATGCAEVLFPETAALLCGAWVQPRQAWNVDRPRMLLLMGCGATFGLLLNLLVPWPVWGRALAGYAFAALMMCLVGADMTPMLSAVILPVLLGTDTWAYPVAVVCIVSTLELGQVVLERTGLREAIGYHVLRNPPRVALAEWGRKWATFALLSAPAYLTGHPLFAAPPLLVAFTELTRPDMTLRLRPARAWAALALAAVVGDACRAAVELAGVPTPLMALVAFLGVTLVWDLLRTWFPPAGAVALLALLVPFAGVGAYALSVSAGAALWVAVALAFPGIRPSRTHEA